MLKWQQDICECGLDLTTANPVDEIFKKDEAGKVIALGTCPGCGRANPMIEADETVLPAEATGLEAETAAEEKPAPKARGGHRAVAPEES